VLFNEYEKEEEEWGIPLLLSRHTFVALLKHVLDYRNKVFLLSLHNRVVKNSKVV